MFFESKVLEFVPNRDKAGNKAELSQRWNRIVNMLTLKQYTKISKSSLKYSDLATQAMKISKSKHVKCACEQLLYRLNELTNQQTIIYDFKTGLRIGA